MHVNSEVLASKFCLTFEKLHHIGPAKTTVSAFANAAAEASAGLLSKHARYPELRLPS